MDNTLSIILTIFLTAGIIGADVQDDILIADFEGKTYGSWKVEGEAFGPQRSSTSQALGQSLP